MTDMNDIRLPRLNLTRRHALMGLGAAVALGDSSLALGATGTPSRLVILNIRGGLDGLAAVIPYGDPNLAGLRASLVPSGMNKIGGFFALHPNLPNLFAMFNAGQASIVHAVGPTVATRSHFEGQDYLQSGAAELLTSGWLNRAIATLPQNGAMATGLAVSAAPPLVIRGPAPIAGWASDPYAQTSTTLAGMVQNETASDALIGPAMHLGFADRGIFNSILQAARLGNSSSFTNLCSVAGALLASPGGPTIAALETGSVDTHSGQNDRLPALLAGIDNGLLALKTNLGSAWAHTVVLTMTEFGRTAYANGTGGTDHGTGFAVFLAGGAVSGGKVITTWPGLSSSQLFQGRDLAPTVDFRSIAMGVLSGHLGIGSSALAGIFPGSTGVPTMSGLVTG